MTKYTEALDIRPLWHGEPPAEQYGRQVCREKLGTTWGTYIGLLGTQGGKCFCCNMYPDDPRRPASRLGAGKQPPKMMNIWQADESPDKPIRLVCKVCDEALRLVCALPLRNAEQMVKTLLEERPQTELERVAKFLTS